MFDPVTYILAKKAGGGGSGSSGGYKGSVATASALPSTASKGDSYFVEDEGITYIYDSGWQASPTSITDAQIRALF